jgi:hypothetical protein
VSDVTFDAQAVLADGSFSGTLGASSLAPGDYEVWARGCLGEVCGSRSVEVML